MRRYYPRSMTAAFADAAQALDVDLVFTLANPLVQTVLDDLATLVRRVSDTTRDQIRALVGQQAAEGWTIPELADEILRLGEIETKKRATLIAVTETAAAYSKGSLAAYTLSGVVASVEWIATLDDQTCPQCEALHGTQTALGAPFADGTDHPPRHPRCRCAIAPIVATS